MEYAINTSGDPTAIHPQDWQTDGVFRDLGNRTYYVFARSAANEELNPGNPRRVTIPNTGWTARARGNVTNAGVGNIRFRADLRNNDWRTIGSSFSVGWGGTGVRDTGFAAVNFAPWLVDGFIVEWDAASNAWIPRNITISSIYFEMRGHGHNISFKNGGSLGTFQQSGENVTRRQSFPIWPAGVAALSAGIDFETAAFDISPFDTPAYDEALLAMLTAALYALNAAIETFKEALKPGLGRVLPGDVNGDGVITDLDVLLLRLYLAGYNVEICRESADVNGDGVISIIDIMLLNLYLAGHSAALGR